MQAMKTYRSIMLSVLVFGFGGAWMTGACGAPVDPGVTSADTATECSVTIEKPCKRYKIQLQGDPNNNIETRRKYKTAFGSACYMSADINSTFNCFYRKVEGKGQACEHAQKVAEVYGVPPYATGYKCQEVPGTNKENYTLQVGPDSAQVVQIDLVDAPLQHPLIEVDAVPTIAVSGPYRNLPEPQVLAPGEDFYNKTVDKNGNMIEQRELILQVNRSNNGGKIRSDLAGFMYPCDKTNPSKMCPEPTFLKEGDQYDPEAPEVHHVVRRRDLRCCAWGNNSNANAVVISRQLNQYFTNKYPSADEVNWVNNIPAYMP